MAESLTVIMSNPFADLRDENVIVLDWVAAAGGTVSKGICAEFNTARALLYKAYPKPSRIQGKIARIESIPGALGVPATNPPTNLYDVTLLDKYGLDVADGTLADRSATVAEAVIPATPIPVDSELTLTIANAGNGTAGRLIIHLIP